MTKWRKGEFVATVEDVAGNEHTVTVRWNGYYAPAKLSGPPEDCYPAEGEIELDVDPLPEGVDFGDLDALHENLEEWAWQDFEDSR